MAQLSETLIPLVIAALAGLYATVRILLEKRSLRKLPHLNVLGFAIAGAIALLLPHPITIVAAAAYFVGSTLESNAIASTYAGGKQDDD